jgi:hypothetical protein
MRTHMRVLMRAVLLGAVLAFWFTPFGALAQTSGTGAASQPAPRDQKIAQALFEAQTQGTGTNAAKPLTLDEIVAMKGSHEGWGEVFKEMKAKGLLTQKNLGQVVKDFEHNHPETAKVEKADKADKPDKPDKPGKPEHPNKPERPGR